MRKIEFKHIRIENFCGIKALDTDLYPITLIKGRNRQGKSTVRNAIMWNLTDKMADGKSVTGIRPHDENGVDIDFVEIVVEVTLLVDGREIVIKKTQKQDWVKDRHTQEQTFKGNVNEFEINGIPKKEKDYKAYLKENVASLETLTYCLTPFTFLSLDTKKRRAKLFELVSNFSNEDVIATNEKFSELENDLKDGTIEELITRSKKAISKFKETLKELPARIDEVAKQIIDMDFAELELQKNDIERRLKENADKQAEPSKASELGSRIMDLKLKLNEVVMDLNKSLNEQKSNIDNAIYDLIRSRKNAESDIRAADTSISELENTINRSNNELAALKDKLNIVETSLYDDSSLICSQCGQEYPADKKEEIKANFELERERKIITLKDEISKKESYIELRNKELSESKDKKVSAQKILQDTEQNLKSQEEELAKLPQTADVSQNEEYQKLAKQIKDMEKQYELLEFKEKEAKGFLNGEEIRLRAELSEVNSKLMQKDTNIKADERIEELKAEQRKISQQIANEERQLDLLEEFNRTKVGMITDKVNSYFDVIKWDMFKKNINGGYTEVCYPIVNGTSYDGLLNNGDKILAEVDICQAFQKANSVELPIIADNLESLDADRLPKIDNQLIVLRREDCDLTIMEG